MSNTPTGHGDTPGFDQINDHLPHQRKSTTHNKSIIENWVSVTIRCRLIVFVVRCVGPAKLLDPRSILRQVASQHNPAILLAIYIDRPYSARQSSWYIVPIVTKIDTFELEQSIKPENLGNLSRNERYCNERITSATPYRLVRKLRLPASGYPSRQRIEPYDFSLVRGSNDGRLFPPSLRDHKHGLCAS